MGEVEALVIIGVVTGFSILIITILWSGTGDRDSTGRTPSKPSGSDDNGRFKAKKWRNSDDMRE